jgi:prolyl oligopeptidase
MHCTRSFFLKILLLAACMPLLAQNSTLPPTPKRPVTDEYHGVKVTDDYRWLENWSDPEVKQWSAAQNRYARAFLDALPERGAIHQRLEDFYKTASSSYKGIQYRGGIYFALKSQPPKNQPMLISFTSPDDIGSQHVVVDPNTLNEKGALSIDWFMPSLDGKLVAVAMSQGGSEDSNLYIFNTATGKQLGETVPRVNFATAGGSVAWKADGSGLYYTRYPQGNERPKEDADFYQQVYFHKLETPSREDTYVIGKDFPRIAEIMLDTHGDGKDLLVSVANGDGGEFEHFVLTADGRWTQVTKFSDQVVYAEIGPDHALYLLSRQNAPKGKILRLQLSDLNLAHLQVVVPEGKYSIEDYGAEGNFAHSTVVLTANRLYLVQQDGGPSRVAVYSLQGKPLGAVPIPPVSRVSALVPLTGDDVLLEDQSYTVPQAWYSYGATSKISSTALKTVSTVKFDDAIVERAFVTSKDGTKVPLNIIHRADLKMNGTNPAHLSGYGGYNISETPRFLDIEGRIWLDQGAVLAYANLRGGGEYGEVWHNAGKLTKKQNVFDDFTACARYLIARKYTQPAKFGIEGGSNGGLLMGAAFTQQPGLYGAVVSHVGIYDMLRVELDTNGAFNVTEYGSVKDPAMFKALYSFSPYHHVRAQRAYPAVLFMTGENDGRVNTAHSRKITAELQAATSSGKPVLLRTSSTSGHGHGTALSERVEQNADALAFFFHELGIKFRKGEQ